MAIKFQYNKTSLHQQEKQLKMRVRTLPTIKSKESALRLEVKKTKDEVVKLEQKLEDGISSYRHMVGLWNEGCEVVYQEDCRCYSAGLG